MACVYCDDIDDADLQDIVFGPDTSPQAPSDSLDQSHRSVFPHTGGASRFDHTTPYPAPSRDWILPANVVFGSPHDNLIRDDQQYQQHLSEFDIYCNSSPSQSSSAGYPAWKSTAEDSSIASLSTSQSTTPSNVDVAASPTSTPARSIRSETPRGSKKLSKPKTRDWEDKIRKYLQRQYIDNNYTLPKVVDKIRKKLQFYVT